MEAAAGALPVVGQAMMDLEGALGRVDKCKKKADLVAWESRAIYDFVFENAHLLPDKLLADLAGLVREAEELFKACQKPRGLKNLVVAAWNANDTADKLEDMFDKLRRYDRSLNREVLGAIASGQKPPEPRHPFRRSLAAVHIWRPAFQGAKPTLARVPPRGECCMCFEPMCTRGGAAVMKNTASLLRTTTRCKHFLCQQCAKRIKAIKTFEKKCPACQEKFTSISEVPDLHENPEDWFKIIDCDRDRSIDQSELVDALTGMFAIEREAVKSWITNNWDAWDSNTNASLEKKEFREHLAPQLEMGVQHLVVTRSLEGRPVPNFRTETEAWFRHWDEDGSNSLSKWEIVRALIKTFPQFKGRGVNDLLDGFASIWPQLDPNNDGQIERHEFEQEGGLYETLLAYHRQWEQQTQGSR